VGQRAPRSYEERRAWPGLSSCDLTEWALSCVAQAADGR
jgi:hypothetical protein